MTSWRSAGWRAIVGAVALGVAACGPGNPQPDGGAQQDTGTGQDAQGDTGVLPDGATPLPFCDDHGVPRACGLQLAGGARTCTPGAMVTVGCNQGCNPPLGTCAGDTVLQVCPGNATTPCSTSISYSDDTASASNCASMVGGVSTAYCSSTTFMCPAEGSYTVWVGSYSDSRPAYACVIGVQ